MQTLQSLKACLTIIQVVGTGWLQIGLTDLVNRVYFCTMFAALKDLIQPFCTLYFLFSGDQASNHQCAILFLCMEFRSQQSILNQALGQAYLFTFRDPECSRHTVLAIHPPSCPPGCPEALWTAFLFPISAREPSFALSPVQRSFSYSMWTLYSQYKWCLSLRVKMRTLPSPFRDTATAAAGVASWFRVACQPPHCHTENGHPEHSLEKNSEPDAR